MLDASNALQRLTWRSRACYGAWTGCPSTRPPCCRWGWAPAAWLARLCCQSSAALLHPAATPPRLAVAATRRPLRWPGPPLPMPWHRASCVWAAATARFADNLPHCCARCSAQQPLTAAGRCCWCGADLSARLSTRRRVAAWQCSELRPSVSTTASAPLVHAGWLAGDGSSVATAICTTWWLSGFTPVGCLKASGVCALTMHLQTETSASFQCADPASIYSCGGLRTFCCRLRCAVDTSMCWHVCIE